MLLLTSGMLGLLAWEIGCFNDSREGRSGLCQVVLLFLLLLPGRVDLWILMVVLI